MKKWTNRLAQGIRVTLLVATGFIGFYLACLGQGSSNPAILIVWLFIFLSLIVHEMGHVVGARIYGMTVWQVNISGLEFHSLRRGVRVRLSRIKHRNVGGYVQAFPMFGRPMRPQMIGLTLGGPMGNFVVAVLCAACGWLLFPRAAAFFLLSFAALNLGSAVVNLIPYQGSLPSDGLALLILLRGFDENATELAQLRLISRSIAGQTADQLPEDEVATLEQQPSPIPLVAMWYRLKADQNRGDWASADSRRERFEALEQALVPAQKTVLFEMLAILRTELAFSRAMLTGDSTELDKDPLPAKVAWASPWLQLRCQALAASLRGDKTRCAELLEASRRKAENSIDRALWSSEALLRKYITMAIDKPSLGQERLHDFA